MMFEEMLQTYTDCTEYLKCRMLQHCLAKLDARSDDSNRGAIQSLPGQ